MDRPESRDIEGARRQLEAVVRELDPSQPFIEIQSLDALMINSVGMQRFYLVVLSAFAVFAVLLAAVGIYAAYSYVDRQPHGGDRRPPGARRRARPHLWQASSGRRCALGAVATAVGLVGRRRERARARTRCSSTSAPTDPFTYVVVGAVLLVTVLVATLIPALRAARIDPLVALRR